MRVRVLVGEADMAEKTSNGSDQRAALRIVVFYVLFATLWILLSDRVAEALAPDVQRLSQIGMIKGLLFVAVSGALLLMVLRSEFRARQIVEADRADLLQREQSARARAEKANRTKDELLALVSHELRTPLTAVLTSAEILLQDEGLNEEQKELLTTMRQGVLQEAQIVGDLLDTTSLVSGKLHMRMERTDVNGVLVMVLNELTPAIREKSLTMRTELSPGALHTRADGRRLGQVFRNLLDNAIKFTPSGGKVTLRSIHDGDRVAVEVEDTGMGIAADLQTRLFEPFEQGDRSITRQFGGLGLGLYLSRGIVEMHGGKLILLSSGIDQGCRFRVELPQWVEGPAPVKAPSAAPPVANNKTVLLVEDNVDTLRALARLLGRMGCTVIPARNAAEAVRAAGQGYISLVICDIGLPDRSGWQLMTQLHGQKGLSGVAISGFSSDEDRQRSLDAGFSAHLVKPVTYQDLQAALDHVPSPTVH